MQHSATRFDQVRRQGATTFLHDHNLIFVMTHLLFAFLWPLTLHSTDLDRNVVPMATGCISQTYAAWHGKEFRHRSKDQFGTYLDAFSFTNDGKTGMMTVSGVVAGQAFSTQCGFRVESSTATSIKIRFTSTTNPESDCVGDTETLKWLPERNVLISGASEFTLTN